VGSHGQGWTLGPPRGVSLAPNALPAPAPTESLSFLRPESAALMSKIIDSLMDALSHPLMIILLSICLLGILFGYIGIYVASLGLYVPPVIIIGLSALGLLFMVHLVMRG